MAHTCPKCATENNDTAKFCKACGCDLRVLAVAPVAQPAPTQSCAQCSTDNIFNAKFCKSCGASIQPEASFLPPSPVAAMPPVPSSPAVMQNKTVLTPLQPAPAPVMPSIPYEFQNRTSSKPIGAWLAAAGVLVLACAGYLWISRTKAPATDVTAAVAAPQSVAASEKPAALTAPLLVPKAPATVTAAVSAATPAVSSKPAAQPVVITESAEQAGIVIDKPRPVMPKPAPPKPVDKPAPQLAAKPAPSRPEAAPAAGGPREAQAPAPASPVVQAQSAGPSSPKEACGSRIFLALSNCMSNQCQTGQFSKHPQCVQLRQEEKERADRASNSSNDR
jgi:hypothetical protein